MAEARLSASGDWVPGNPWFWMGMGLLATAGAWVWVQIFGDSLSEAPFVLIGLGLLAAGGAITLRLNSARPAFLESTSPRLRGLMIGALLLVFGLLALTLTVLLLLRLAGEEAIPWKPNQLVIVWFLTVPMTLRAFWVCWRKREPGRPVTAAEEGSALLLLGALACFLACRALYLPGDPQAWDTIRLLFAVLAFLSLAAAPLVVAPQDVRRGVVSVVILLHFGGICTAVLEAPPTPWIINQVWTRIYRPYLEFMYLINAYHFYAPEPGPASYLWFRIEYEDQKGKRHGEWYKVPDFDERGRHKYPIALLYQRYLALTENTQIPGPAVPKTKIEAEFLQQRLQLRFQHTPDYVPDPETLKKWGKAGLITEKDGEVAFEIIGFLNGWIKGERLGLPPFPTEGEKTAFAQNMRLRLEKILGKVLVRIPYSAFVPPARQYMVPPWHVKQLMEAYSRHVASLPSPDADYQFHSVKIYRVVHYIPPQGFYLNGVEPNDPVFYTPYFMGEYDQEGKLLNKDEPFLYWVLPILRDVVDGQVMIRDFTRKHAGDPNWVFNLNTKEWMEADWPPK